MFPLTARPDEPGREGLRSSDPDSLALHRPADPGVRVGRRIIEAAFLKRPRLNVVTGLKQDVVGVFQDLPRQVEWPRHLLIEHHRDIDIAVGLVIAAGARAEQIEGDEAVAEAALESQLEIGQISATFGSMARSVTAT